LETLDALNATIVACRKCPRLVEYRERIAREKRRMYREDDYWGKPVPGWGDLNARLYIVGLAPAELQAALAQGQTTAEEADAIFRLTSLPTYEERFVVPPLAREQAIELVLDPFSHKPAAGFGFRRTPARGA
jgi:hypothetical protein